MQYSSQVNEYCKNKDNVLAVGDSLKGCVAGVAGDPSKGAWVGFVLRVDGQRIASLKFQVFGCPQLLAACAYVAEQLQDCELTSIDRLDTAELMLSLQIPTEKAGKILTLQDALTRCRRGLPVN
jgi:NifU-like protein involved in Fe-S cluster formation|tara:strand:- start:114 stop:485 length:372 start_codon:yes stop_codon:yes gene_type:complete